MGLVGTMVGLQYLSDRGGPGHSYAEDRLQTADRPLARDEGRLGRDGQRDVGRGPTASTSSPGRSRRSRTSAKTFLACDFTRYSTNGRHSALMPSTQVRFT